MNPTDYVATWFTIVAAALLLFQPQPMEGTGLAQNNEPVGLYTNKQPHHASYEPDYQGQDVEVPCEKHLEMEGSSMQPTLYTGHVACFKLFDAIHERRENLREGDIVMAEQGLGEELYTVHRVDALYWKQGIAILQGDNNKYRDERINISQIEGEMTAALNTDWQKTS